MKKVGAGSKTCCDHFAVEAKFFGVEAGDDLIESGDGESGCAEVLAVAVGFFAFAVVVANVEIAAGVFRIFLDHWVWMDC